MAMLTKEVLRRSVNNTFRDKPDLSVLLLSYDVSDIYSVKLKDSVRYYVILNDKHGVNFGFVIDKYFESGVGEYLSAKLSFVREGDFLFSQVVGAIPTLRQPVKSYIRPWIREVMVNVCYYLLIKLVDRNVDIELLCSNFNIYFAMIHKFINDSNEQIDVLIK